MRYGAPMDKIPKWFLVMVGSAMLLIGGAMAVNAGRDLDNDRRNREVASNMILCKDSLGRINTVQSEKECREQWDGTVLD